MVMEKVRLRLVFEGHHILKKSQKKQGLNKCWILIKPKLYKSISHLSSYLLRIFQLQHSSPHGLILSMDGFVLPPFESTSILKDNDIICVRKKAGPPTEILDLYNTLEQPALAGVKLLANEESQKVTGGYESESEENEHDKSLDALDLENTPDLGTVCKKRKASKKLQGTKKKKSKLATAEESPVVLGDVENVFLQKVLVSKDKSSDMQGEPEKSSTPEFDETSKCTPNAKRFCELQENGKGHVDVSSTPSGTKKFPSRSARRKKAKRQWLRDQAKNEKIEWHEKQSLSKGNQQSLDKDDQKLSDEHQQPDARSRELDDKKLTEEYQQPDPNSDADDDVVPVVIRPGHIRFTPLTKVDAIQAAQQNQIPAETFQWKGVTSKKKGQKWGKEKAASKWNNYEILNQERSEMVTTEEEIPLNDSKDVDFDKLKPYTSLPEEGDVIAYRLIELSSSWTPEPTSFRVGKISWYNLESNRIMLLPVPEYPLDFEKKIDEDDVSALQSDTSLYEEDGSLQIDFSLLVDVRIVMHGAKSVNGGVNEVRVANQDAARNLRDNNNNEKAHALTQVNGKVHVGNQYAVTGLGDKNNCQKGHAPIPENGKVNVWEEINEALSAKKAELSHVDDQSIKEASGSSRSSYKALRSSALGPTMAFLRSQSGL